MSYDAVIVGAGITGTYIASLLSQKGIRTCIIERNKNEETSFCGELVASDSVKQMGISLNSDLIQKIYKKLRLVYLDNDFEMSVPRKREFSCLIKSQEVKKMFLERALSNGAVVKFKSSVKNVAIKGGKAVGVKTNKDIIRAGVVIGADGSSSVVARSSGFDLTNYKTLSSFRFKYKNVKGIDQDEALFIAGRELGLGYMWLYPRGNDNVNIGIGGIDPSKATLVFKKYVKERREFRGAQVYSKGGNLIPCSGLLPKISRSNVVLLGDSAGQVNSLLGAGVSTGTHAARFLSEYIVGSIENDDISFLEKYDKEYRKTKIYLKNIEEVTDRLNLILRMHKKENIFDIFEEVLENISTDELVKVSHGGFGCLDALSYCLKHPVLFSKLFGLYLKYR